MNNMENKNFENVLRDAQFRKGLSIAYFNSLNSAIEMLKVKLPYTKTPEESTDEGKQKTLEYWHKYFLDQYSKFHAENISSIGIEKIAPSVVEGLDKAKQRYENTTGSKSGNKGVVRG